MRRFGWLIPIAVMFSFMVPAYAEAGNVPPTCDEEKVIEAAIETMEDWLTENNHTGPDALDSFGNSLEKLTTETLRDLGEDTENPAEIKKWERITAKNLRIDKTWVRYCFSSPYEWGGNQETRTRVIIVMHPYNPGEWGLIMSNLQTTLTAGDIGWGWVLYPYPEKP